MSVVSTAIGPIVNDARAQPSPMDTLHPIHGRQKKEMLERVDKLVARMETTARGIAEQDVSGSRRAVLVTHFNDLQRQVNALDGIFGSEGQGEHSRQTVSRAVTSSNLNVDTREKATRSLEYIKAMRNEIHALDKINQNDAGSSETESTRLEQPVPAYSQVSTLSSAATSDSGKSTQSSNRTANLVDLIA